MPPKLRIKSAGKSQFGRSDRSLVSKTYCPTTVNGGNAGRTAAKSEFGLLGSNMQINLRLGGVMGTTTSSKRMAQSTPSLIGASCKSESVDCLHTSILRDSGGDSSARKIHSDRPATAGFVLHRKQQQQYATPRRRAASGCAVSRDVAKNSSYNQNNMAGSMATKTMNGWLSRTFSSQSNDWYSSVDSELATVGSVDLDDSASSSEGKRSYAVFSSFSCDESADHFNVKAGLQMTPEQDGGQSAPRATPANKVVVGFHTPRAEASQQHSSEFSSKKSLTEDKNVVAPEDSGSAEKDSESSGEMGGDPQRDEPEKENMKSNQESDDDEPASDRSKMNEHSADESVAEDQQRKNSRPVELQLTSRSQSAGKKMEANDVLSEILHFLDDANKESSNSPALINSETESNIGVTYGRPSIDSIGKLHGMTQTQLTEEVLSLQMLLQDKDTKLVAMERALQHQRELLTRNTKTAQRELNLRFKAQKEEYETTLKRHVSFIQQLVEEKKKLAEKCETLAGELRQQSARFENEKRVNEERHANEMKRLKQMTTKDQRHQQEKWVMDRTQHIREVTARGLEPELRRLMAQHQIELQSLRAIHQDELLRAEQASLTKTAQQLNSLRDRLDADREEACAREREIMRTKFEKQLDEMENIHVAKFQRLQAEFERERKRWIEEEMRNKKQDDDNLKRQEEKWRREIQASTKLLQAEVETLKQQHSEQIAALKKTWDEDKREELAALRHTLEVKTNERERQLVESRRKEREEDAQNFARHLAEELQRQHEEQKMLTEQQVQRIREKHAEELASSDRVESELRNKLTEIRRQLTDRDEELATLRMSLFQHLKENKDMKKLLEQYTAERTDLKGALQKELEMEFRRLEEEKRELLDELSTLKFEHRRDLSRANAEISNMTASHEKMLADIHERVKQAVSKKDEALTQMQQKLQAAIGRCQHLEELIDRQHRDLLDRKKK